MIGTSRFIPALIIAALAATVSAQKICIDPGHGGSDSGAVGNGQYEKTNALNTGLKFRNWLNADSNDTAGGGSWSVIMTRSTDIYVSLSGRTDFANNNGADRFMSIHNNACGCGASGTETFSYTYGSSTSHNLRNHVQQRGVQAWGLNNRGNKTANFYVIRYTSMPSELAELGFIDTAYDAGFLGNSGHQDTMARHHLYALQSHYGIAAYTPTSVKNPSYFFGSSTDGFTPGNGSGPIAWTNSGWPGVAYADQTGNDMFWYSPATSYGGGGDPSINVQVYPQNGSSANHTMQMFWKTTEENYFSADKSSQRVNYTAQNGWKSINLSLNNSKYWWKTISQLRLDFDDTNVGARFIVNHVYLQTTPRHWFGSSVEGWSAAHNVAPLWQYSDGWPGILVCDQTGTDPHIHGPVYSNTMLGASNDVVRIRVYPQNGNTANHDMKVYWNTGADNSFTESKSVGPIYFTAQNTWIELTFNVGQSSAWAANWIRQLRVDFTDKTNTQTRFIIDHIMIDHTS